MASVANEAVNKTVKLLTGSPGLSAALAALVQRERVTLTGIGADQIVAQNVTSELVERSAGARYPAVYVYCEGLANVLKEKFRTFSGKVFMAMEVRVSHDRLEGVSRELGYYVEALTEILDRNRGEWSRGVYYTGGYKVEFGPVRHGGRNFLQAAKIRFELEASVG